VSDNNARDPDGGERSVKLACEAVWKVFGPGAEAFLAEHERLDERSALSLIHAHQRESAARAPAQEAHEPIFVAQPFHVSFHALHIINLWCHKKVAQETSHFSGKGNAHPPFVI